MDKLEPLWSESKPALSCVPPPCVSEILTPLPSQEEASSLLLQHPEVRQPPGAAGVPVSDHAGWSAAPSACFPPPTIFSLGAVEPSVSPSVGVQLCVESCPNRHLTLVKAKLGNKDDHEYYKQYCKDGVDFAKLVSVGKPS